MFAPQIRFEHSEVIAGLKDIQRRGKDLRQVFRKELAPMLRRDIRQHFDVQGGARGRWPGYSAATIQKIIRQSAYAKRKALPIDPKARERLKKRLVHVKRSGELSKRGEKRIDNLLGRLKTAFRMRLYADSILIWNRIPFSAVHEFGGPAGRGVQEPERAFIEPGREFIKQFEQRVLAFLLEKW